MISVTSMKAMADEMQKISQAEPTEGGELEGMTLTAGGEEKTKKNPFGVKVTHGTGAKKLPLGATTEQIAAGSKALGKVRGGLHSGLFSDKPSVVTKTETPASTVKTIPKASKAPRVAKTPPVTP